jgi:hypothetical protein
VVVVAKNKRKIINCHTMEQFSGNYTGPYWSDGRLQESVEFGSSDPQSELDKLSRLHDTAYAHYTDRQHREAADEIYERDAKVLAGKFPELAGKLVLHGNYAARQRAQLNSDFATLGPLGLLKFAGTNMWNANKMIKGTYLKNEKADIERLYGTDPRKGQAAVTFNGKSKKNSLSDAVAAEFAAKAEYEKTRNLPLEAKQNQPSAPTPVIDVKPKKTVIEKAQDFIANITKKNTVTPESKEERNARLIQAQQRNFENYQNTYMRAQLPQNGRRKYKKKKYNMIKAIRVLPAHMIH